MLRLRLNHISGRCAKLSSLLVSLEIKDLSYAENIALKHIKHKSAFFFCFTHFLQTLIEIRVPPPPLVEVSCTKLLAMYIKSNVHPASAMRIPFLLNFTEILVDAPSFSLTKTNSKSSFEKEIIVSTDADCV